MPSMQRMFGGGGGKGGGAQYCWCPAGTRQGTVITRLCERGAAQLFQDPPNSPARADQNGQNQTLLGFPPKHVQWATSAPAAAALATRTFTRALPGAALAPAQLSWITAWAPPQRLSWLALQEPAGPRHRGGPGSKSSGGRRGEEGLAGRLAAAPGTWRLPRVSRARTAGPRSCAYTAALLLCTLTQRTPRPRRPWRGRRSLRRARAGGRQ